MPKLITDLVQAGKFDQSVATILETILETYKKQDQLVSDYIGYIQNHASQRKNISKIFLKIDEEECSLAKYSTMFRLIKSFHISETSRTAVGNGHLYLTAGLTKLRGNIVEKCITKIVDQSINKKCLGKYALHCRLPGEEKNILDEIVTHYNLIKQLSGASAGTIRSRLDSAYVTEITKNELLPLLSKD